MKVASKKVTGIALATAAAALFLTAPMANAQGGTATGKCVGGNSCKGQSSCKGANNSCKGQNSCKGKGFTMATPDACKAAGGTIAPASK